MDFVDMDLVNINLVHMDFVDMDLVNMNLVDMDFVDLDFVNMDMLTVNIRHILCGRPSVGTSISAIFSTKSLNTVRFSLAWSSAVKKI
jgi:uncharacterized protein YjbI with pentapeptide repeats